MPPATSSNPQKLDPKQIPHEPLPTSQRIDKIQQDGPPSTSSESDSSGFAKVRKRLKPKLDIPTLIFMVKGSLPVAICLCLLETDTFTKRYGTQGSISAIIALLGCAFLPRAKFYQNIILEASFVCVGASFTLLTMYCGIKARNSTMDQSAEPSYNYSQAVICTLGLFVDIWAFSMIRTKSANLSPPVFLQNVFVMVTLSFAPRFATMQQSIDDCRNLLELFLIGMGIATAVHLFVFPLGMMTILRKKQHAFIASLGKLINLQVEFLVEWQASDGQQGKPNAKTTSAIKSLTQGILSQYQGMMQDLPFAEKEISWGRLSAADMIQFQQLLQAVMIPTAGMSFIMEIMSGSTTSDERAEATNGFDSDEERFIEMQGIAYGETLSIFLQPFRELAETMDAALHHAALRLGFEKSRGKSDMESTGQALMPGSDSFTSHLEDKIEYFHDTRNKAISAWHHDHNIKHSSLAEPIPVAVPDDRQFKRSVLLYFYMGRLASDIASTIRDIDSSADEVDSRRNRLIYPEEGLKALWPFPTPRANHNMSLHRYARNPEHLHPVNSWEHGSDYLRKFAHLMRSTESIFGFRVALATLSATIMAFLRQTYDFYFDQRLIWSTIVVVVGWHLTAGQSFFALFGRIVATLVGICFCWLAYYIPDGHPGGIIPIAWFFLFCLMYFFRNYQRYFGALIVCCICTISVIGTKLLEKKLGDGPFH